jgi:4-amino-4-deoxy-L-arabinose transferase-like glycosyltransferase
MLIASLRIVATYKVLSNTTDEPAHLAAGIEWIENGTYTYENQHPPLARVAGAMGLHLAGSRWSRNNDMYVEGFHLLGQNGRYTHALFYSRLCMLPFFWVGAATVYFWTRRIAGNGSAVFATLLFTTMPPVLAHAGLVTTDMALTAFVGASLLASLYWVEKPGWPRSIILGLTIGLALLSKFSALAFLPMTWMLWIGLYWLREKPRFAVTAARVPTLLRWSAVTLASAALLVWAGYRFTVGPVNYLHATLPAPAFFTGIAYVASHNRDGQLSYLLGSLRNSGFWYYYPVVLAVKTPIPTLILMVASVWFTISRRARHGVAFPLAMFVAVLAVGLFSNINIGVRHILPVYIAFAICGGVVLGRKFQSGRKWILWAAVFLIVRQVAVGVVHHPDYLAYTNEFAGRRPERVVADSDLDWEQGMRGLALRLRELRVQKLTFAIRSSGYMLAGNWFPEYALMPPGNEPTPGWNAVSVTQWKLTGEPKWAEHTEPLERIRGSILLYYFPLALNPQSPHESALREPLLR